MKRLFILVMLAASLTSAAQMDTLHVGDRVPNYYYWDTNWWDHYHLNYHPENSDYQHIPFSYLPIGPGHNQYEYARYIYSDTTLYVIGVAAAAQKGLIPTNPNREFLDTSLDNCLPEYFRIYTLDSVGDMVQQAELRWDTASPRYMMSVDNWPYYCHNQYESWFEWQECFGSVYEAYLEKPILLRGEFYVSGTTNNNYLECFPYTVVSHRTGDTAVYNHYYYAHPLTRYYTTHASVAGNMRQFCSPHPGIIKFRANKIDECQHDAVYGWQTAYNINDFVFIFPILDTGYNGMHDPGGQDCPTPQDFSVLDMSGNTVYFTWSCSGDRIWELCLYKDGTSPDSGIRSYYSTTMASVGMLDTATWYTARVRTLCDSSRVSEWSDSVRFYFTADNNGDTTTTGVPGIADRFSYVMPNPASESVTVASSFLIDEVDIYTLSGQCVASRKVGGISTSIDISSLPSGTYIIRIATIRGVAHKKLVVKR